MQELNSLLLPLFLGGVLVYVLVSQQRKAKQHKLMLDSVGEGDEIIMSSGIHGFVSAAEENTLWVEIAEGVEVKVSRSAVQGIVPDPADESEDK